MKKKTVTDIQTIIRAAGYGRVSTEEQAEEGHSLEAQEEKIIDNIEREKWTLVGYFSDPGYSGKNLERPDIKRLLAEIERNNIDVLVVHKLDRLTRDIGDLYNLMKLFDKHNVKFVSITEKIDTDTAMGRMFIFMLGIFAQWYRENLSEEVRKGMEKRAKKGLHNITVPLFGYDRLEDGELRINEEQAKWVYWTFEQYLKGIGTTNLAKMLNDRGVYRNKGAKWDQHKVALTLRNYHYTGKVHWKSALVEENERIVRDGKHEAIIPVEMFEQVQRILERRREGLMSRNSYEYVYGGIIKCGKCGGTYKGKYNKTLKNTIYRGYVCSNNERYGSCDASGISELNLTKLLFGSLNLTAGDLLTSFTDETNRSQIDEREEIQKQMSASEVRRSRWQRAYGDGLMPYDDFAKLMKEEMDSMTELSKRLADLPRAVPSTITPEEALETLRAIKENWPYLEQSTKKQVMQSLFQQITILKENDKWIIEDIKLA
ncbi:recombinase family protein [Paenibacillus sp. GYB003]|uniref:recombinase family protein n=1 Tax=Paenibacillus sp. GYB003 TaxID=2994392 RepID=UPI002F96862D